jgi:predicted RNA-binding protein YlxR (DUF448 family)
MAPSDPQRSCVGCRTTRPVAALVRVTDGAEPTIDGPSSGRGAWLCRHLDAVDAGCLELALRTGGFQRAWRRALHENERNALRQRLAAWTAPPRTEDRFGGD